MGKIKILKSGLFTTVQDEGRVGYRNIGVAVSGAMDTFAYSVSNYLVGNKDGLASIEVTMVGPEIKFYSDELISICGADLNPHINGNKVRNWTGIKVHNGDILSFKVNESGSRAYISFSGGLSIEKKLGSYSTNVKAKFGGFKGEILKSGNELTICTNKENINRYSGNTLQQQYVPNYKDNIVARVVLGPQDDYFTEEEINKFFDKTYEVSSLCDRMGYRLNGESLKHIKSANIISDANNVGAIQVPGDGMPIVLMNDCGTTGGYPKIGTVICEDISRIAQLKTGGSISFKKVDIEEALNIYKEHIKLLEEIKKVLLDKVDNCKYYEIKVNGNAYSVTVEEIS